MSGHLVGANAKLLRAEETTATLIHEVNAFLDLNTDVFRVVGELRNGNKEYVLTVFGDLTVPVRFSVLLGEVMYQLRTALDHLLSALVLSNGGSPSERHQFPICSTAEKFVQATKRGDIAGVSPRTHTLVEIVQPYQPEQPRPPMLDLLREWTNADKHRLLVVVGGAAALGDQITIEESDGDFSIVGMTPLLLKPVTSQGADVFTLYLGEPHARFRARAEILPNVGVGNLGNPEFASLEEISTKMVGFIKHVFSTFAEELK